MAFVLYLYVFQLPKACPHMVRPWSKIPVSVLETLAEFFLGHSGCGGDGGSNTAAVARCSKPHAHVLAEHLTKCPHHAVLEVRVLEEDGSVDSHGAIICPLLVQGNRRHTCSREAGGTGADHAAHLLEDLAVPLRRLGNAMRLEHLRDLQRKESTSIRIRCDNEVDTDGWVYGQMYEPTKKTLDKLMAG
jgi:hypothetical protein